MQFHKLLDVLGMPTPPRVQIFGQTGPSLFTMGRIASALQTRNLATAPTTRQSIPMLGTCHPILDQSKIQKEGRIGMPSMNFIQELNLRTEAGSKIVVELQMSLNSFSATPTANGITNPPC